MPEKTIKLSDKTYAIAFNDKRIDIRTRDYISNRIICIPMTKQEIIALADELKANVE